MDDMTLERARLGVTQQNIADLAGVDIALVEKFEKRELNLRDHEQLVAHDKIYRAFLTIITQLYPEKVKAALDKALETGKKYPEGSEMRNFINNSVENIKKSLES